MNPVLFKDWGRGFPPRLTTPLAPENLIVGLVLWTNSVGKHSNPGPLLSSSLVDWSRVGFDLKDPNFWQVHDVWLNHRNANRIIIQQSYTAPYWTVCTSKRKMLCSWINYSTQFVNLELVSKDPENREQAQSTASRLAIIVFLLSLHFQYFHANWGV